jgi:DNA repair exonuclease SbcCD ATPase subunit
LSVLVRQAEVEKLKKALQEAASAQSATDKDVAALKKTLAELEAALKASRAESATLAKQLQAAQTDGEHLKAALTAMTQAKADADQRIAALAKQGEDFKAEIERLKRELELSKANDLAIEVPRHTTVPPVGHGMQMRAKVVNPCVPVAPCPLCFCRLVWRIWSRSSSSRRRRSRR